ncbi:MAG: hypothetical protein ACOYN0_18550 [Phycisphaerales bacterium]
MRVLKQPMVLIRAFPVVLILAFAVVVIAVGTIGDVYKLRWMIDWLSPILMICFLVALSLLGSDPAKARGSRVARIARAAAIVAPTYAFMNIELAADAPIAMRLFGRSWTIQALAAGHFLLLGGLFLGALIVGLSWMEVRSNAAAAARAAGASPQGAAPGASSAPR